MDACEKNTIKKTDKWGGSAFECQVALFPDSDEEEGLSDSLRGIDSTVFIKMDSFDNEIKAELDVYGSKYDIRTSWQSTHATVSKEEFLAAAKKLIDKFPRVTTKFIRVVH